MPFLPVDGTLVIGTMTSARTTTCYVQNAYQLIMYTSHTPFVQLFSHVPNLGGSTCSSHLDLLPWFTMLCSSPFYRLTRSIQLGIWSGRTSDHTLTVLSAATTALLPQRGVACPASSVPVWSGLTLSCELHTFNTCRTTNV